VAIPFVPTGEQVSLRDSVRRWATAKGKAAGLQGDTPQLWGEIAELGWLMAGVSEENGGLGGTAFDVAIIADELGRELIRQPFVEIAAVSAQVLAQAAPSRLEALVTGESRPLLAHDEPGARGMRDWVNTTATRGGDGFVLNGRKTGLIAIDQADALIVSARLDGELALFWAPVEAARLIRFETLDGRAGATAVFEDVALGPDTLLASSSAAEEALAVGAAHALVLESAEAVGAMRGAFEQTRAYVAIRRQFNQRIGDFQVIRHALADMIAEIEQAHSMVLRGIDSLADPSIRDRMASATKARAGNAGLFVGGKGIQLHGGVGMTEEYAIGHYYKRLLVFSQRHGTADDHILIYAGARSGRSGLV
jgi:alkylation response protein AidB-like acyl-CoA dehydrogenase